MHGEPLLHFSEDPSITRFEPHIPVTNPTHEPAVWAIDADHAPVYWFPRDCPRGSVWANDDAQRALLHERFQTTALRVHATELGWLDRIRTVDLYVYELDRAAFEEWPLAEGQWICARCRRAARGSASGGPSRASCAGGDRAAVRARPLDLLARGRGIRASVLGGAAPVVLPWRSGSARAAAVAE